ncbi:hypothetical protein Fmac_027180 [Flemingia macrophylla]|uniref:Uncharacterized protein n=1 Tax=Flemingia macrophylla TaxID=520843 RepID=A0ABD1LH39_9FABA
MPAEGGDELVPPNCFTCLQYVRFAYIYTLGLCGAGVEDIEKMKQKHTWSRQLLKEFLTTTYETYMGSGGLPSLKESNFESDDIFPSLKEEYIDQRKKTMPDREETVILVAARNGIVEMVEQINTKFHT